MAPKLNNKLVIRSGRDVESRADLRFFALRCEQRDIDQAALLKL